MILGIGTDLVEIARIRRLLELHGDAFRHRVFTPAEIALAAERRHAPEFYAGRWAAKEAAVKALGCGFGAECGHTDIEILCGPEGEPVLRCRALPPRLSRTAPDRLRWHISITHERSCAAAFVILERN